MFAQAYESHDPQVSQAIIRARAAHGEAVVRMLTGVWRSLLSLRLRPAQRRPWGTLAHG